MFQLCHRVARAGVRSLKQADPKYAFGAWHELPASASTVSSGGSLVSPLFFTGVRCFSSPVVMSDGEDGAPMELTEALASEIAQEAAEEEVDPELEEIKAVINKTWTIFDEVGTGIVTLHSTQGNETIEITFDCQDEATDENADSLEMLESLQMEANTGSNASSSFDDEVGDEGNMEGADELNFGINFTITICKPTGDKLIIDAVAGQQLSIGSVQYVSKEQSVSGKSSNSTDDVPHTTYGGPIFDQLEESLQDAFYDYLEDRHVDDDLCFFVLSYARHKEQQEYVNWLQSVLKFAEN